MIFGAIRILAGMEPESAPEKRHDYPDEKKSFMEMLKPPMTLAQGAAIMNERREKASG